MNETTGGRLGVPYRRGWHRVGAHCWAWLEPDGGWGLSNAGSVVGGDEALLVDTLFDLAHTRTMLDGLQAVRPGVVVRTVVNTHANGDHFWGNQLVEGAQTVVSANTAHEMRHGPGPRALQEVLASAENGDALGTYLRELNRGFDFAGIQPPPPSRVFTGSLDVRVGETTATAIDLGPQHSEGDTVVWEPDDRVLFAGDLLFIGVHPVMWAGPITNWIATCSQLEALKPRVVVPGHGPLVEGEGVRDFRAYLEHVQQEATARFHLGMPWQEAALDIDLGRWAHWRYPERLAVTVSSIYRDLAGSTESGTSTENFKHVMAAVARINAGVARKPRLRPLQPAERDSRAAALLSPADTGKSPVRAEDAHAPLNLHTTLARNSALFPAWGALTQKLADGQLPDRDRELAILRTAVRCGCAYEWAHHTAAALDAGLTAEEIARSSGTSEAAGWAAHERAILDCVDELHAAATITSRTWDALAAHYTDSEVIELVLLIGHYHEIAFALNAFRTPMDAWAPQAAFPGVPAN